MVKQVIVFGGRIWSTMLFHDAIGNKDFAICCFTMERNFIQGRKEFLGLPLIPFEDVQDIYTPYEYDMLVMFNGYRCMRERKEKYLKAKDKGYLLRNYFSAKADIAQDINWGENNIILGQTHIGFGGSMGDNNLISQNAYVGHEFKMGSHNEITASCTIGGECEIKDLCYIGFGSTIINNIRIAEETLIGAGSLVIRNTEPYSKIIGNPSRIIGYHRETGIMMV